MQIRFWSYHYLSSSRDLALSIFLFSQFLFHPSYSCFSHLCKYLFVMKPYFLFLSSVIVAFLFHSSFIIYSLVRLFRKTLYYPDFLSLLHSFSLYLSISYSLISRSLSIFSVFIFLVSSFLLFSEIMILLTYFFPSRLPVGWTSVHMFSAVPSWNGTPNSLT